MVITLELCEIHIGGVGFLCGVNEGMLRVKTSEIQILLGGIASKFTVMSLS